MSNDRYDFETKASPFQEMRLLYVSTSRFGGDWHSTLHTHTCLELFYCVRGAGEFHIDGETLKVIPDDLIIVNSGVEHTEVSLPETPLEYIVLGVDGVELLNGDNKDLQYRTHNFRDSQNDILFCLTTMLREIEEKQMGHETICKNLLEILLIRILRHTQYSMSATSVRKTNKECAEIKRYIDTNYPENITLDLLANLTHVNKYYLVHAFHKEFNISPINYLISRRIKESKYLLINTNYSLSQISHLLGFSSPSYFSQSFRRLEAISPGEYRKHNKNLGSIK
ncbi:MAG: AraC family transcriptional regulator [Oscillospiraceae bacterium]